MTIQIVRLRMNGYMAFRLRIVGDDKEESSDDDDGMDTHK